MIWKKSADTTVGSTVGTASLSWRRNPTRAAVVLALVLVATVVAARFHERTWPNLPLEAPDTQPNASMVLANTDWNSPVFVGVSLSGGGARAASFASAVLNELDLVVYPHETQRRSLLQDVRIISAVSGGSLTAAWYGLTGKEGLKELNDSFLQNDNMRALYLRAARPQTLFRLLAQDYSRVDVFREFLESELFRGRTFGDLFKGAKAPLVVLNATDMGSGEVFSFTRQTFDDLCADLNKFPIATAVAASAAYPGALTPVTLVNYMAPDCRRGLAKGLGVKEYVVGGSKQRTKPGVKYIHLLDGGLVDNLGELALMDSLPWTSAAGYATPKTTRVRSVVLISVNAGVTPPSPLHSQPSTPGLLSVFRSVASIPIDAASRAHAVTAGAFIRELIADSQRFEKEHAWAQLEFPEIPDLPEDAHVPDDMRYIEFKFRDLIAGNPEEVALMERVHAIPTSWTISREQLADIQTAAHLLVQRSPGLRDLMTHLKASRAQ